MKKKKDTLIEEEIKTIIEKLKEITNLKELLEYRDLLLEEFSIVVFQSTKYDMEVVMEIIDNETAKRHISFTKNSFLERLLFHFYFKEKGDLIDASYRRPDTITIKFHFDKSEEYVKNYRKTHKEVLMKEVSILKKSI